MWGQYGDTYPNETSIYQAYNVESAGLAAGELAAALPPALPPHRR